MPTPIEQIKKSFVVQISPSSPKPMSVLVIMSSHEAPYIKLNKNREALAMKTRSVI